MSSGKDGFTPNPYPEGSFKWGIEVDRREELIQKARLKEAKRRSSSEELAILQEQMRLLTEHNEKAMDAIVKAAGEKEAVEKNKKKHTHTHTFGQKSR